MRDLPAVGLLRPADLAGATLAIARDLLGTWLVRELGRERLVGRIVETEAYLPQGDPASHAHRGETPRNRAMFGAPGRAYVYRIYGMHHCVNVVTEPAGTGAAVLIRALEPLAGVATMTARRGRADLTSGPGKLCEALAIDRSLDQADLLAPGPLYLWRPPTAPPEDIAVTPRVGIREAADLPARFFLVGNRWVSRGPKPPAGKL